MGKQQRCRGRRRRGGHHRRRHHRRRRSYRCPGGEPRSVGAVVPLLRRQTRIKVKIPSHPPAIKPQLQDRAAILGISSEAIVGRIASGADQDRIGIVTPSCKDRIRLMTGSSWLDGWMARIVTGSCWDRQDCNRIMTGSLQERVGIFRIALGSYYDHDGIVRITTGSRWDRQDCIRIMIGP